MLAIFPANRDSINAYKTLQQESPNSILRLGQVDNIPSSKNLLAEGFNC